MIPRNKQNYKAQVNVSCPTCGMSLMDAKIDGFVLGGETFCCQGCADGSGCTCSDTRVVRMKAGNRATTGHRNPENSTLDNNFNGKIDTSGRPI